MTMKKLFLFLAAAAFAVASCNNDDDTTTPALTTGYLTGTWIETAPAQNHQFDFTDTTAKLTFLSDSSFENYNYTVQDSTINLSLPGSDYQSNCTIEIINSTTFKFTSLYVSPACATCEPVVSTFVKADVTNQ
jgi:hypothetical protein